MKEAMDKIRALCDSAPVIGQDSSYNDAEQCSMTLNEINEIALEKSPAEPEERNADGDTRAEIQAAHKEFGNPGIEMNYADGSWRMLCDDYNCALGEVDLGIIRITAKHAYKFDPVYMSFETWHESVIEREMACQRTLSNGTVFVYDHIDGMELSYHGAKRDDTYLRIGFDTADVWTAIPRAEALDGALMGPKTEAEKQADDAFKSLTSFSCSPFPALAPDAGKAPSKATEGYLAGISIAEPRDNMPEPKVRTATLDGYRETAKRIGKRHAPDAGKAAPQADDAGEGGNKYTIGSPYLHYTCDFAVYPSCKGASICYCTDLVRAQMVVDALNHK